MTTSWLARLFGQTSRTCRRKPRFTRLDVELLEGRLAPTANAISWVSGVGDDLNPGSRTAPNKTFAGAISNTSAGGIIQALDPGGFGTINITQSVTIDGTGTFASILATSGINAININAGANDVIVLRHLKLQGAGSGGTGIRINTAAEVHIEDCVIQNFTLNGIDFRDSTSGAKLFISNTDVIDCGGNGVFISPGSSNSVSIDHVRTLANAAAGFSLNDGTQASISNSIAAGNQQYGFVTGANISAAHVDLVNDIASNNGSDGVSSRGPNSFVTHSGLTAVGNSGAGTSTATGGSLTAFGSNMIADNNNGVGPATFADNLVNSAATRTWVSGVGDNANPFSRTAPGKTFAGAIDTSKTSAGGEIDVLDPGDFGTVTISNSITIDATAAFGGIQVSSGGTGITVNAGSTDVVILRGLSFDGTSQTGLNGIKVFQAGAVILEDCTFKNFSGAAIDFEPTNSGAQLFVENCTFIDNAGGGVLVKPSGVMHNAKAFIDGIQAYGNQFGVRAEAVDTYVDVSVTNSVASGNTENGFQLVAGSGSSSLTALDLQNDISSNNGMNGVASEGSNATVNFANLTAVGNSGQGTLSVSGGTLNAIGSNQLTDNAKGFTPITLAPGSGGGAGFRRWVSGVGDDLNPGSRTAPDGTFAGALADVAASGEIDALDSGDFGAVTIDKSVTIDGGDNYASSTGITINAGAADVVILRHLRLHGFGSGTGIQVVQAGAVIIEDCDIENFDNGPGIDFEPSNSGALLFVHNTRILHNASGVFIAPSVTTHTALASLDHVDVEANNQQGLEAVTGSDVTVSNSVVSGNLQQGLFVQGISAAAQMNLESDVLSNNGSDALFVNGASANVALSNVTDTGNSGQGIVSVGGGSVFSFGNNRFADNANGFTPNSLSNALGSGTTRNWVSGVGDDANPGDSSSRTAPLLTFGSMTGAFSKTAAGGEIDALDQGEFGTVGITHSITIDGGSRSATILTTGATNGILVQAGPHDVVILRGLTLNGFGGTGLDGIQINSAGAVFVEDCLIENFSGFGINFQPTNAGAQLFVTNCRFLHNTGGSAGGIYVHPVGVSAFASIDHVQVQGNLLGVEVDTFGNATLSNSQVVGSADGLTVFTSPSTAGTATLSVESVISANNSQRGLNMEGGLAAATAYLSNVAIVGNAQTGLASTGTPAQDFLVSFGNIEVTDNGANGAPTSTLPQTDTLPTITSPTATNITANSATLGGNITSDGGATITQRGVVFALTSDSPGPIIGGNGVTNLTTGGTTGMFSVNATGLTAPNGYSFAPYAFNRVGLIYTIPATFTTSNGPSENFNGPNSPNLGPNWTTQSGSIGVNNGAGVSDPSAVSIATYNSSSLTDVIVQADFSNVNALGARAGLVARYSGSGEFASNYYLGMIWRSSFTGVYEAYLFLKQSGHDYQQIGPALDLTGIFTGAGTVRFEVVGNQLKLFLNNELRLVGYDSTLTAPGQVGLRAEASTVDNFSATPVSAQSTPLPFTDHFTNGANADLDRVWTEKSGAFSIQSNTAAATSIVPNASLATLNTTPLADAIVQADISVAADGSYAGLVTRVTGPDDFNSNYYLGVVDHVGATFTAYLFSKVAGASHVLLLSTDVTAVMNTAGAKTLRFETLGNQLKLYINNALQLVTYDSTITTAGAVGMRGFNATFDEFNALAAPPINASLSFLDQFNTPTNRPDLDRVWTEREGAFSTQNNNAAAAAGLSLATLNLTGGVSNGSVQASVNITTPNSYAGLVARYSGPEDSNFYLAVLFNNGGVYQAYLFRNQAGAFTQLAEQDLPAFSGTGVLRFDYSGQMLKLFVDSLQKASALDSTFTTGTVGMRAFNASLDDFSAS